VQDGSLVECPGYGVSSDPHDGISRVDVSDAGYRPTQRLRAKLKSTCMAIADMDTCDAALS
jgi:hypothetical protein